MKTKERNNMKTKLFQRFILVALVVAAFSQSCTKLDEKLYSEVTPANFFKSDAEFVSALGAAYTNLGGYAGDAAVHRVNEVTTDEMVVPTRGSDWDDGGTWRRLFLHAYSYEDNFYKDPWTWCYAGISTDNRLIYQFSTLASQGQVDPTVAASYIAELVTLRSFFYMWLIDMYGNVPYDNDFAHALAAPPQVPRLQVYDSLVTSLEANVPLLTKTVGGPAYARMNYYAGKFLQAKLYMNAEVYGETTQWDKAIAACDSIINSGKYSLEADYFANFNVKDEGSKEFIFAIPYDQIFFQGFNFAAATLHYPSQFTYNLTQQPWNGYCSLEKFYNSYDPTDLRRGDAGTLKGPATKRGNFVAGYQYVLGAGKTVDAGADPDDPDGPPLNFGSIGDSVGGVPVPQINMLGPHAWRQAGVRIGKWEFAIGADPGSMSNDYAVFRYADVLLMKAEALWRKSNNPTDAAALALVNQIRERAGLTDMTSLDGKLSFDLEGSVVPGGELFNERGREMAFEHWRRQDLIRWGFFEMNAKWTMPFNNPGDVLKSDTYLRIFPINKFILSANSNLHQNPGY